MRVILAWVHIKGQSLAAFLGVLVYEQNLLSNGVNSLDDLWKKKQIGKTSGADCPNSNTRCITLPY